MYAVFSVTETHHWRKSGAEPPAAGGCGGLGAKPPSRYAISYNFLEKNLF